MRYDDELDLKNENSLSIMIKDITPDSTILEFGPSNGRLTKYLKENLGCSVYIVEIDKEAYQIASEFAKDGICGDIEDLEWHTKFNKIPFDFIIFGDVLEHLVNPQKTLEKSVELLKDSGKVLISVPNIANNEILIDLFNNKFNYTESGILDNSHLRFFTYYTLLEMIEKEGLIVVSERATYKDQNIVSKVTKDLLQKDFGQVFQFIFSCMKYSYYIKNSENIPIEKNVIKKQPNDKFKIYLKSDGEYDESCTWNKNIFEGINEIQVDLSQYKSETIRIDFSESTCAVKLLYLNFDEKEYNICNLKGSYEYNKENIYLFFNDDPHIIIDDMQNISKIKIGFDIQYIDQNILETEVLEHYKNEYESINKDKNIKIEQQNNIIMSQQEDIKQQTNMIMLQQEDIQNKQIEIKKTTGEIEGLKKGIEIRNMELAVYENSTCWKITKPIRIIGDFIKKIKQKNGNEQNGNNKRLTDEIIPSQAEYNAFISVIIPTYNGMEYMEEIIDILRKQRHIKKVEIIIVDSGSTDGTVEFCKKEELKLIQIPNEDFSHSYARNLGAEKAKGDILVFLTQDASPTGVDWLYNMITPIKKHGMVAVSCKHKCRDDCETFFRVMNDAFDYDMDKKDIDFIGKKPRKGTVNEIRKNARLSNNACAIINNIFRKYKFRDEINEDLDLGVRLINDGYQIAILTSEKIIHSHNRKPGYYLKRGTSDLCAVKRIFKNFELYDRNNYENFASGIICGYAKVCEVIKLIEKDKFEIEDVNKFLEKILTKVSYNNNFNIENIKFGYEFSDVITDKFLSDILNSLGSVDNVNYLSLKVKEHIGCPIKQYFSTNFSVVKAKEKEDVIDCIFKFFTLICGQEIASYFMLNPNNMVVNELVKELKKGV